MNGNNTISIYAATTLAIAIADGYDSNKVKLFGAYFYLIGSVLSTIGAQKALLEEKK